VSNETGPQRCKLFTAIKIFSTPWRPNTILNYSLPIIEAKIRYTTWLLYNKAIVYVKGNLVVLCE